MAEKKGRIVKILSNRYSVLSEGKIYVGTPRGKLKFRNRELFVGDFVRFSEGKPFCAIEDVLPRKNALIRPYVANLDTVFIVIAPEPEPDFLLVDKILLNCFQQGIRPVLCYNKCDLLKSHEIKESDAYRELAEIVFLSAETGENVEKLREYVQNSFTAFAGQSAVGKTSLLNRILDADLLTGGLSRKVKRGKNTTRHVEVYEAFGGQIADTCGFSMLETADLKPEELRLYYDDFLETARECRYRGCTHVSEPDCAVRRAAEEGKSNRGRYERYLQIFRELKEKRND